MIREHLSTDCHYLNVICWSSSKSPIKSWKCLSWFDSGEHSKQSWIMHSQFFVSQAKYFSKSQSFSFVFSALMSSLIFWWMAQTHTHTHTLWVPDAPANIHHFGCKAQKVENPVLLSGLNLLNKARSSFELHSMSFLNIVFVHNTHEIFFSWKLLRVTIILIKCLYKLMVSLFTTSFPFFFSGNASNKPFSFKHFPAFLTQQFDNWNFENGPWS